jgi:hypothetical protein
MGFMAKVIFLGALSALIFSWWLLRDQSVQDKNIENDLSQIEEIKTTKKLSADVPASPINLPVQESIKLPQKQETKEFKRADAHSILGDKEGNILLEEAQISGGALVYQSDLFIEQPHLVNAFLKSNKGKAIQIAKPEKWPEPIIPFTFDQAFNNEEVVLKAMKYMESKTKIRFRRANKNDEYYVRFNPSWTDENCYSFLGRVKRKEGQSIALGQNCGVREIVHELMHVLGFIHEQSRHDRDNYITINWDNIKEIHHQQFSKFPSEFVDMGQYPFDFNSIMLYPSTTFSQFPEEYSLTRINGEPYPIPKEILSPQDIKRVNDLYPD